VPTLVGKNHLVVGGALQLAYIIAAAARFVVIVASLLKHAAARTPVASVIF